ncbi:hypothetical protein [Endozoicomonas acroporae]|uniref:hypothetical protein n=1 Tax=Endozoicomonas acroporae TaxID=1701104 RepID=UPI003D7A4027
MDVAVDSIWDFKGVDGIPDGLYRVLKYYSEIDELIIFQIVNGKTLLRPMSCDVEIFKIAYKDKRVVEGSYALPGYLLLSDIDIPEKHKIKRDKRFLLVKPLVEDDFFYYDVAKKIRVKSIIQRAKEEGVSVQTLYRILNDYWKYGQDVSSLTPAFKKQGGKGKSRIAGEKKRGAPVESRTGVVELNKGINILDTDKEKIMKGLDKYYLKADGMSIPKAYKNTILEYYATEVTEAEINGGFAKIPTLRQFRYWKKELLDKGEEIKKRSTKSNFLKNKRGLLSSAVRDALIPGECFEMDSTVADIHVVSKFNRNKCLGRPIIYLVIDKASRMIVGVHVSMEYASWRAGRQALINCFTKKKSYCEKFGINIVDSQWPCFHIPRRILCDRGEMICKSPEELVVPLMQLDIAAPYRADMKGIVERRFRILNDEALHGLIGTTKGTHRIRGEDDPRARAQYTIDEVTKIIIKEILKHNRSIFKKLLKETPLLIENDLDPTPINTWNIHLLKHRHSLKVADEEEVRAKLLPAVKASMTGEGISYNGMYYSCKKMEEENWASIARSKGWWPLEARADSDNSSFLYVRLSQNGGFTKCYLLPKSNMLRELSTADIDYVHDYLQQKEQLNKFTTADVYDHKENQEDERRAAREQRAAPKNAKKSDKINGMNDRRKEAIDQERKERYEAESISSPYENVEPEHNAVHSKHEDEDKLSMFSRRRRSKL